MSNPASVMTPSRKAVEPKSTLSEDMKRLRQCTLHHSHRSDPGDEGTHISETQVKPSMVIFMCVWLSGWKLMTMPAQACRERLQRLQASAPYPLLWLAASPDSACRHLPSSSVLEGLST
mmetsp:Transcript_40646/g.75527  ORF Transcript_40646/g.75527 Transcript_40646/m.75527 type:complete len:119 (+) Transcript_40646:74-430(+)